MLPILVPPHFCVIAHRGASAYAPENTRPAFDLALEMGYPEIELDAQLTTDGVVAICHDATLARYGHGPRVVEDLAWADLAALDMGSWFSPTRFGGTPMLTLDTLFATYGDRARYHVELKGKAPGLAAAVQAAILRHGQREQCVITSFSYDALAAMAALDTGLPLGWLVRKLDKETLAKARGLPLTQLCPVAGLITADQVQQARRQVAEVRAWGLNGESVHSQGMEVIELIHRVVEAGCDGMTINWPDWARPIDA